VSARQHLISLILILCHKRALTRAELAES